jgi:glycosyltransferase involved in cell wall biosynthesis
LPSVTFFCPAYHDEHNLPKLIPRVHQFLKEITPQFEIIIINDGSPDNTGQVAESLAAQYPEVRVLHHPVNLGYGATLRDGFRAAKFEYVMYTDGDNQYDVYEFKPVLHFFPEADIISGYARAKAVTMRRKLQSLVYNALVSLLFFVRIKDINCSMKIYKRSVLEQIPIKSTSAFIDAEMLIRARRKKFRIVQFPVTHYERLEGLASGSRLSVMVPTLVDMIKFRLGLL